MSNGTSSITIITGNLGSDPELKYMPNGDAVLNISVATSVAWKDRESGERKSETEWHRCVLFRNQAENAAKYLSKGSKVQITGRNRTRRWIDETTKSDRYTTEIIASDVQYLDRAPDTNSTTANVGNATDAMNQIPSEELPEYTDNDFPR